MGETACQTDLIISNYGLAFRFEQKHKNIEAVYQNVHDDIELRCSANKN